MTVEFSESGYLEVWCGAVLVSKHRQEREAIESVLRHSETAGSGDYEIRRPVIRVKVKATVATTFDIDAAGELP